MARIILVCQDKGEQTLLEACLNGHQVVTITKMKEAAQVLADAEPDLLVAKVDGKHRAGLDVLRLMRRSRIDAPAVFVLPRRGGPLESEAWQLGVRDFVQMPIRYEEIHRTIQRVLSEAKRPDRNTPPPISDVERRFNLSFIVEKLTKHMKCPAGTNRVIIRSVISGLDQKSEPRVALRCPIRQAVGLEEYVYFKHIRDVCCKKPENCDALQQYKKLRKA